MKLGSVLQMLLSMEVKKHPSCVKWEGEGPVPYVH